MMDERKLFEVASNGRDGTILTVRAQDWTDGSERLNEEEEEPLSKVYSRVTGCDECAALASRGLFNVYGKIQCPHGQSIEGVPVYDTRSQPIQRSPFGPSEDGQTYLNRKKP